MDSKNHLMQMAFLSSIDSKISIESVSESILNFLESLEMIYEFEKIQIPQSMKDAYCAVAIHCTFRCLPGNSAKSILADRISKLKILNSQLLTDNLRDWKERIRVLQSNPDDLNNWKMENDSKYKEQALIMTRYFLSEAMSFIEHALKQTKENENRAESQRTTTEEAARAAEASEKKDEESKEKETNMEGKDKDMEDSRIGGGECKYSEVVGVKCKEIQEMLLHKPAVQRRRYRGPAKIVCCDDLDSDNEIRAESEEAEARKKRDERESKEKETNLEGNMEECTVGGGECTFSEIFGAKGKEIQEMLLHKPSSQQRRYRGPAKIVCSDDLDSDNEVRAEIEEAATEVGFLDREAEARKKRDERISKEKETNMEGNMEDCIVGGGECTFSEIFGAKGQEIHGEMLLHKPAAQQRRYKGPARIVYSDDLDSEIVSSEMYTSLNQASMKAAVINSPTDNPKSSDVKQAAVSNPPVDSSKSSDVKQAAVSNPLIDESLKISLDSPKRKDVSPLKRYENTKFTKRRPRNKWTLEEEDALREGVKKYGAGNWKFILNSNRDIFSKRQEVDLKDKWRNMMKPA